MEVEVTGFCLTLFCSAHLLYDTVQQTNKQYIKV